MTLVLWDAFTPFLRMMSTFLSLRWDATQLEKLLISIIAYSFGYRTAFLVVDVFLHLLWLRSFFNFAYFLVFVMTILPFNWNWNHFSQLLADFFFSILAIIRCYRSRSGVAFSFMALVTFVFRFIVAFPISFIYCTISSITITIRACSIRITTLGLAIKVDHGSTSFVINSGLFWRNKDS